MDKMSAIVVAAPGPPSALKLLRLPVPHPGPGAVRLKVAFVGLNLIDAMLRRERLDWLPVTYPFIPGAEHTGIVDEIGDGVHPAWLGRRVLSRLSFGGYAQYSIAPAAGLVRLDDRMSLKTGCAYRGASLTAWHALHSLGRIQPGESVLVHSAAGAIGIMAIQIALDQGARPIGLAGGPAKVQFGEQFGALVIDYLQPDWPERALAANGGRRFDVILDGNSGPSAERNYELVAPLGRIVFFGASAGRYPLPVAVERLVNNSCSVSGMTLRQIEGLTGAGAEQLIVAKIVEGQWKVPISEVRPLQDAAELHRLLEARALKGRVVMAVDQTLCDQDAECGPVSR